MQWGASFLMIFLLGFAQVDDLIVVNSTRSADPVTSDDDEFLPAERHVGKEKPSIRQRLSLGDTILDEVLPTFCFAPGSAFLESCRPHSLGYSTLYVFMSLRR
jgi:hypothetical protein